MPYISNEGARSVPEQPSDAADLERRLRAEMQAAIGAETLAATSAHVAMAAAYAKRLKRERTG